VGLIVAYRENAYRVRGFKKKCKCTEFDRCNWHAHTAVLTKEFMDTVKALGVVVGIFAWIGGGALLSVLAADKNWMTTASVVFIVTLLGSLGVGMITATWPDFPNWVKSLRDARRNSFEYVEEEE
jgi:hypothetical protein